MVGRMHYELGIERVNLFRKKKEKETNEKIRLLLFFPISLWRLQSNIDQ